MRLPRWALGDTCTVQVVTHTAAGRLGEARETWTDVGGPRACASFPATEKALRVAGLLGVQVTREVYLDGVNLSPTGSRLVVNGVACHVRSVQEWDGFTVALCEEVT